MKFGKIILIGIIFSFGLNGCYTKIGKPDVYEEEYQVIKEKANHKTIVKNEETEYDTVYVYDDEEPAEESDEQNVYYIYNNYDYDIYRHYFDTYTPCLYCDGFYVGGLIVTSGLYYYTYPSYYPVYYYPPWFYSPYPYVINNYWYPPYYYPPVENYNRPYNAGLRNNFGRGYTRRNYEGRRGRLYSTSSNATGRTTVHGATTRNGKQVNLDNLVTGRNSAKTNKRKNSGRKGKIKSPSSSKIDYKKDEINSITKNKTHKISPPVSKKEKIISREKKDIEKRKTKINYRNYPTRGKDIKGNRTQKQKRPKKKIIIHKKRSSDINKKSSKMPTEYRRSGRSYRQNSNKTKVSPQRNNTKRDKYESRSYKRKSSRPNKESSRKYSVPKSSYRSSGKSYSSSHSYSSPRRKSSSSNRNNSSNRMRRRGR